MGDNGEVKKETAPQLEPEAIKMEIVFYPVTGKISVAGPINNRTLSYGMLEMAKEAIYDLKEQMKENIKKPDGNLINFLRQRR